MKLKKCPRCNKMRPENEVGIRKNPYIAEIYGEEIFETMCDECEGDLAGDI